MVQKKIDREFVLDQLKSKSPSDISKEFNISKQLISYYLKTLKANGNINKIGYGTWEVKDYTSKMQSQKKIRGHAFIWTIQLNKKIDWTNHLKNYQLIRGLIPRIIINNKKLWLGKKTITIYDNISYYGENSIQSRKYAVLGLKQTLEALEKLVNLRLTPFKFKVCKEHYSMIKNELARQYNEKGEKMIIRDDIEGEWLWIDDSESLNELETKNIVRSKQVQDWWNDNKQHDFKVTPTFILESFAKSFEIQNQLNVNIQSHLKLIKTWEKESKARRKIYEKELTNVKNKSQKSILDF